MPGAVPAGERIKLKSYIKYDKDTLIKFLAYVYAGIAVLLLPDAMTKDKSLRRGIKNRF